MVLVKDGEDARRRQLSDTVIIIIIIVSLQFIQYPHYYVVFFHLGTDENNKQEAFIGAENV